MTDTATNDHQHKAQTPYIPNLTFAFTLKTNRMEQTEVNQSETQQITEGLAKIKTLGNVFYNPVQEFNRDLRLGHFLQPLKF